MATATVNAGAIFPMYNELAKQQRFNCSTYEGIPFPVDDLPVFSFCINQVPTQLPMVRIFRTSTDSPVQSILASNLKFTCRSDGKVFMTFNSKNLSFLCGSYYYEIDLGNDEIYYSEVFKLINNLDDYYLLTATGSCPEKNNSLFIDYIEELYFKPIEDYPNTFRQEVTATDGNGTTVVKSNRTASIRRLVFCNVFDNQLLGLTSLRDFEIVKLKNLNTGEVQILQNYSFSFIPDAKDCLSIGTISFEESVLIGSGCCENEEEGFTYEDCVLNF